jgi:hypothetical protein
VKRTSRRSSRRSGRRLFPDCAKRVNLVGGGSKRRVRDLYAVLDRAASRAGLRNRFFAVVDRDLDSGSSGEPGATEFVWPVYHIENFLLQPDALRAACGSLRGADPFTSDDAVLDALHKEAAELVPSLVLEQLRAETNQALVSSIDLGADPATTDPASALLPSIESSIDRLKSAAENRTLENLQARAAELRDELNQALESEAWREAFPGRRILKAFAGTHLKNIGYDALRNVTVDKLAQMPFRPAGMNEIFDQILAA